MHEFAEWDSFYLIVGGAAGALIGLQFVVMTLIADRPAATHGSDVGPTFSTPTIIHFGAVLLLAAVLRAPWRAVSPVAEAWGAMGLIGVVYIAYVTYRMRGQDVYKPVAEDWIFHSLLPFVAYAILAVSALYAATATHESLFGVGTAALMLLFIGIHNAWDATTYNVFTLSKNDTPDESPAPPNDTPEN